MKFMIVLVVLCAAIGLSHQKFSKENIDETMKKVLSDCGSREGASEADIEFIRGRNLPESKPQKCLTACVGEDAEMIKAGSIDIPYIEKLMKKAFGDSDPKVAIALEIANECAKVSDPDRCENVSKIYACSMEGAQKRNLKIDDFI